MSAISDTRSCWFPSNTKLVIAGLDPAIHHSLKNSFSRWMPGSSPGMTKTAVKWICGMIAFKPSFQARTLSLQARSAWRIVAGRGRLRTWIWATPHAGTFAHAGY